MEQHDTQLLALFERFGGNKNGIEQKKLISLARQLHLGDRLLELLPCEPTFEQFRDALVTLLDEHQQQQQQSQQTEQNKKQVRRSSSLNSDRDLRDRDKDKDKGRENRDKEQTDLWEGPGTSDLTQTLARLGLTFDAIKIDELTDTLDEEAGNSEDVTLLKATLMLWRNKARDRNASLVKAEREIDGLREQLVMAEKRAALLARDVDESQAALVATSEAAVKKAEDKLAEEEKRHRAEMTAEKEKFSCKLSEIELTLADTESENSKLKTKLSSLESDKIRFTREIECAKEEVKELSEIKKHLTSEMKRLVEDREKKFTEDAELRDAETVSLRQENEVLSSSNKVLRDRIDELEYKISEIEENSRQPRKDSLPEGNLQSNLELAAELNLTQPLNRFSNGFTIFVPEKLENIENDVKDTEYLSPVLQQSTVKHYYFLLFWLLRKILEDLNFLSKTVTIAGQTGEITPIEHFKRVCDDANSINLDNFVSKIQCNLNIGSHDSLDECDNIKNDFNGNRSLTSIETMSADKIPDDNYLNEKKSWEDEKNRLNKKCSELENSIDLLRNEYEKCEEYWSMKLEEERDIFDKEQRISDDKFADLLGKIAEYEEQFGAQENKGGQLSTIEEKYNLEKQFTDLEDEFEEYKKKSEASLKCKTDEIQALNEQISQLQETKSIMQIKEIATEETNQNLFKENQVNNEDESDFATGTCHSENSKNKPVDNNFNSPINYLWNQSTIPSPLIPNRNNTNITRDYQNPAFNKTPKTNISNTNETKINPIQKPEPAKNKSENQFNFMTKEKQPKHFGKILHCSELEESLQGRCKENSHSQSSRASHQLIINNLEMKCLQLQCALRQQQMYTESLMRQTTANHKSEIGALMQQLAAIDLLVRDLYVENCHLTSKLSNISS